MTYTTGQAAAKAGITRQTLHAWIAAGKIRAPKAALFGPGIVRLWRKADMARLLRVKEKIYQKRPGRPKKG